jgi:O-antigen/teichoic acid export membrane protein
MGTSGKPPWGRASHSTHYRTVGGVLKTASLQKLKQILVTTIAPTGERSQRLRELRGMLVPIASLGATRVAYLAAQLLASVVLGRTLGPEGKGMMAILVLVPAMVFTFSHLGLGHSMVYYYGAGLLDVRRLCRIAVGTGAVGGGVAVAVFLVLMRVGLHGAFGRLPPTWLAYAACLTPVLLLLHYLSYAFLAQQDFAGFNLLGLLPISIYIGLLVVFAVKGSLTVPIAFVSWVLGHAISVVCALLRAWPSLRTPAPTAWPGWGRLFRFGLTSYANNVVEMVNNRAGTLLVNYWLVPSEVGLYTVAVGLTEMLWLLPDAVSNVLLPRSARGQRGLAIRWTVTLSMGALTLAAAVLWLGGRWIIPFLYGPSFLPATRALRFLLPGALAMGFVKSCAGFVTGRGYPQWLAVANMAALLLAVTGNLLLIPRWGIQGAAFASTLGYTAAAVVLAMQVWRRFGRTEARGPM